MHKLKIFVSAYACEPGLGSEIGVGWHWVLEMSKQFELWVLTRESNRNSIEPWIEKHPEYQHIHWLYYDLPKWARFWKKGLRGVRTYYNLWQYLTNGIVKHTMQQNNIHIFHHLTYGNALWKVSNYGQKQFFIWGPIGGLETIPYEFSKHYNHKSQFIESIRRIIAKSAPYNIGLRRRCENANLILCKTEITRNALPNLSRPKTVLFTDVATELQQTDNYTPSANTTTKLICVGRLDAWRGFDLAIEAVANATISHENIHLTIIGDGSDKKRLEHLINKLNVNKFVTLAGKVSATQYRQLMQEADVVVNPALKEAAVTVSFDSMTMGRPLICLDTTGYTRYFNSNYAIIIKPHSKKQVIQDLTESILRLTNPSERLLLGEKAKEAATRFCWKNHGLEICDTIFKAYSSFRQS